MKLKKVISGGQTGADRTGLECAKQIGLETGGYAPKGYRTDEGPAPELGTVFGLAETEDAGYKERTWLNVEHSDITLWFGKIGSPGYWCTKRAADKYGVPFHINPSREQLAEFCKRYETWNVAGNRKRLNPGVVVMVQAAFNAVKDIVEDRKTEA